jgi:hypothetical protein
MSDAVALYNEFSDTEEKFRELKDVLAIQLIYYQVEHRAKA